MVLSRKSGLNLNIIQTIHGVGSLQAMISVFILYSLPSKKSLFDKFLYLFNFIILILSSSGKVYLALFIITLYHLYIQKNYIINFFILTTITSLSLYVIKFLSSFDFGKLEHLGGRLLPWKMMIEKIKTSPFLGYGFPFGDEIYIDSNFTIQNAHNFIIGSTLYIGFLGPILLILYFKEAYNKSKNILYIRYLIIGIIITANFNISISGKLNIPLISALLVLTYSQNLYSKNHA
jgi:O-antigen ligase